MAFGPLITWENYMQKKKKDDKAELSWDNAGFYKKKKRVLWCTDSLI